MYSDIIGKPTLAAVATSSDYADLINTPAAYTLPTSSAIVLGGVLVDGNSISISGGVISTSANAIGLGNANNTSDINKPISTATQVALDLKADLVGGLIPSNQLPGYVDDVLEFANLAAFPVTGEAGKIYLDLGTAGTPQYRWSGSAYSAITSSPGSTDSVPEGATNLYFTETRVRGSLLTGLSTAAGTVVAATHTVLQALGFLQKQISDAVTSLAGKQSTSEKDATGGYAGLTLFKINFRNVANTFTSFLTNTNTAVRTYTFQNRDGTIADDTDLAGKQNAFTSQAQKLFFASPNAASGVPAFRAIVASDIPALSYAPTAGSASITTLGTISTGTWQGTLVNSTYGGTGVNNGGRTLSYAGNVTFSGAFAANFTFTGATSVTFPTSGTLLSSGAIGVSVQAYSAALTSWASKAVPTGVVVGTMDAQTLTNKTFTGYAETTYPLAGTVISASNGTIQTKTLTGATTFTETLANGESIVLMLNPATFAVTWPTISWITSAGTGAAPTLKASAINFIVLGQVAGVLYGEWIGSL